MTDPRMTPTNDAPVSVEQCDRDLIESLVILAGLQVHDSAEAEVAYHLAARHRLAGLASAPAGDGVDWEEPLLPLTADRIEAPRRAAAELRRIASNFGDGLKLPPALRDVADEIDRVADERDAALARPHSAVAPAADDDWFRGDWYEKWQDATENASDDLMATLEALRGRVERTIAAALARPRAAVGERDNG